MTYKSLEEMKKTLYKRTLLDEIIYYGFYIWWNWLESRPREIKWFLQRGFRGYADCDTWDFDDYLIDVINGGLKRLQKHKCGIPTEIYDKYKNNIYSISEAEALANREWNEIFNQIINRFSLLFSR